MKKYQKMKNNNVLLVIGLFICLIMGCTLWYAQTLPKIGETDTIFVSDTIRQVDTLTVFKEKPIPKEVIKVKVDTFYTKEGNDTTFITENKVYQDSLCVQNDTAIVTNYISGINAKLDSTKVQLRITKETITNTVEITKYIEKKKTFWNRFHLGVQAGYGYGFEYKGLEPYVGLGGSFDL